MLGPATFPRLAKRRPAAAHTLLALLSLAALPAGICPLTAQTIPASTLPSALRGVGLDQRLGDQVPRDLVFRDEQGDPVSLERNFGDRPVILALVYYECPMLCSLQLGGLVRSLRALTLNPAEDFEIVTISFDPGETPAVAAQKKAAYLERYARAGAESGWHFLTGAEESIQALTRAVGFRYAYDPETDEYSHAAGIVVLTPEGRISRYFYGIEYPARDLRLGLVEASGNRIGSFVDQVLLFCFHYDPLEGKYNLAIMNGLRVGGLATVFILGGFVINALRRDRRNKVKAS